MFMVGADEVPGVKQTPSAAPAGADVVIKAPPALSVMELMRGVVSVGETAATVAPVPVMLVRPTVPVPVSGLGVTVIPLVPVMLTAPPPPPPSTCVQMPADV
jgi:hypothetical protein